MKAKIVIEAEFTDGAVLGDFINILELTTPYIADNVVVYSEVHPDDVASSVEDKEVVQGESLR